MILKIPVVLLYVGVVTVVAVIVPGVLDIFSSPSKAFHNRLSSHLTSLEVSLGRIYVENEKSTGLSTKSKSIKPTNNNSDKPSKIKSDKIVDKPSKSKSDTPIKSKSKKV